HSDLRAVLATVLRNARLLVTAASGVADARAARAQGADPGRVALDLTLPDGHAPDPGPTQPRDGRPTRAAPVGSPGTDDWPPTTPGQHRVRDHGPRGARRRAAPRARPARRLGRPGRRLARRRPARPAPAGPHVGDEALMTHPLTTTPSMTIRVSAGTGTGRTPLAAFDAALAAAGVSDFNLVRLSAVVPPGSDVQVVDGADQLRGGHGDVLF